MRNSKKIYMLMIAALMLTMPLHSQVFQTQDDLNTEVKGQWEDKGLVVPIEEEEEDDSKYVPVGSSLAMLAALGGAYLLGKRKKQQ
ncbi:MAG: PEP-CTERM sorting domain-containing protein [Bacteroidales bacterium]|nr:PEP-CTERM sorting domain-containing protein [Bacteroidales bacterium]